MAQLCYGCFKEYEAGSACPHCGYSAAGEEGKYPHALKAGSILGGRYIVGRVLGQGGFGITYTAQDYDTKQLVAIKEFLPESIASRLDGTRVGVYSVQNEENFRFGKEKFLAEAQTLSQFNGLKNICDIYSYFEENGTAYFAMEYVKGVTLSNYMENRGGALSVEEAKSLLLPVMETLGAVHEKGIIHRDIAPDNIMVRDDGGVVLIDFGAARYSIGEKTRSLTVMLKYGFAPKEQYGRRSKQGPYTDVYAMAATFYYAITGTVPPDAIERGEGDELKAPRALGVQISPAVERALLKGLAPAAANRWQSMGEFAQALQQTGKGKTSLDPKKMLIPLAAAAALVVALGAYFGISAAQSKNSVVSASQVVAEGRGSGSSQQIELAPVATATPEPTPTPKPTPTPVPVVASGKHGTLDWSVNAEGLLLITGNGSMHDFDDSYNRAPWWEYADQIRYISIPNGISNIGDYAFAHLENLVEVDLSNNTSIQSMGSYVFYACSNLEKAALPKNVGKLHTTFYDCVNLREVKLPENMHTLGAYTFFRCKNLPGFTLPGTLREVESNVCQGCVNIEYINYQGNRSQWGKVKVEFSDNTEFRDNGIWLMQQGASGELYIFTY